MFTPPTAHPTDAALADYVLGRLPDPDEAEVEAHLNGCPDCQARAATARPEDTLSGLLVEAGTLLTGRDVPPGATPTDFVETRVWGGSGDLSPPSCPAKIADRALPEGLAGHPRYRLVRPLGAGGMGDVWLAEHAVMGRPVALKVIRPELLARPGAVERFRREVRAVAALQHPNIVTAFDADAAGGTHFLVMEYVPGETLLDVVRRGPLPVAAACRAARDAARGLSHAHSAGLVHRDVKPSNLIRTPDGTVKLLDFGLVGARVGGEADAAGVAEMPSANTLTAANLVMGTPDYMAPEQAADARAADARSDVYALGCTLYHLLAGRVPYPAATAFGTLDAHRDPNRAAESVVGIPAELARVLARMMAKSPSDRYPTAGTAADALEPFCTELVDEARPAAGGIRPLPVRRRLAVAAGVLLAIGVAAAAGVVYKIQRDNQVVTVETNDPDIEVVMKRNGELVRIVDTKTKQAWELDTRKMRLKPDGSELDVDLPGEGLVLRRNGDAVVTVERRLKPVPDAPAAPKPIPPAAEVLRLIGPSVLLTAVAYSPDGTAILATCGRDSEQPVNCDLVLWDARTGTERQRFRGHRRDAYCVAFSADGKRIVSGSAWPDMTIRIWDTATGREVTRIAHPADRRGVSVYGVAFAPDGKRVFSCADDRTVRAWDAATGAEVARFAGHPATVRCLALSPDGRWLASGGIENRSALRLWDVRAGKEVRRFEEHADEINAVAFSADGARLASAGHDGSVRLWDVKTGQEIRRLAGHTEPARGVAFTPDGRRVVSGGADRTVRVWDADTGRELARFEGHTNAVRGIAVSPDGVFAVSGGADNTARVWRLPESPALPAKP